MSAAKALEEKWAPVTSQQLARTGAFAGLPVLIAEFYEPCDEPAVSAARCRLASAAPDMARVLLEMGTRDGFCLGCGEASTREGHGADWDCALDAALKKAGVR